MQHFPDSNPGRHRLAIPLSLILIVSLLFTACGDNSEDFLEQFFDLVYREKHTRRLNNRMTDWMRKAVKRKRLGIFNARERLSEKYKSHELTEVNRTSVGDHIIYYGLIREEPKRGVAKYRTFIAKFADSELGYLLYDMIIVQGKKLEQAGYMIDLLKLSRKTKDMISSIDKPVSFLIFSERSDRIAIHLVREFCSHNIKNSSIVMYNPNVERGTASTYGISEDGYIVIEQGDYRYRLKISNFFHIKQDPDPTSDPKRYFDGERMLAMGLNRTAGDDRQLLFVTGIGERSSEKQYKEEEVEIVRGYGAPQKVEEGERPREPVTRTIENLQVVNKFYQELAFSGFRVHTNSLIKPEVSTNTPDTTDRPSPERAASSIPATNTNQAAPGDSTASNQKPLPFLDPVQSNPVMVLADPRRSFTSNEQQVFKDFLDNNGRLLLMLDTPLPDGYDSMLSNFGLGSYSDSMVIVDPAWKDSVHGPSWFESVIPDSRFTKSYQDRVGRFDPIDATPIYFKVLLSESLGFYSLTNTVSEWEKQTILSTSSNGWAEADYEPDDPDDVEYSTNEDSAGPIPTAYTLMQTKKGEQGPRILLFGDCDFITDIHFHTRFSNWVFLRDMLNWLHDPELFFLPLKRCNLKKTLGLRM